MSEPAIQRFRLLTSELALSLAPRPLSPAETIGISGFEFSIGNAYADISQEARHWQGQPGAPIFEGVTDGHKIPAIFWVPYLHLRKGLPLSTEIGVHSSYLAFSSMFMVGADLKITLHESYLRWFPSISTRTAFSTLFGASDFVISTGELDVLASLPIGIGGMVRINPYIGVGMMFMDATSDVIDETPYNVNDQSGGQQTSQGSLYTFPRMKWYDNTFQRFMIGTQVQVSFIKLLYEINVGIIGHNKQMLQSHSFQIGFDA